MNDYIYYSDQSPYYGWGFRPQVDNWLTDRVKEMRAKEVMPHENKGHPAPMVNPITDDEKIAALLEEVTALRAKGLSEERLRKNINWIAEFEQGRSWLAKYLRRVLRGEK